MIDFIPNMPISILIRNKQFLSSLTGLCHVYNTELRVLFYFVGQSCNSRKKRLEITVGHNLRSVVTDMFYDITLSCATVYLLECLFSFF